LDTYEDERRYPGAFGKSSLESYERERATRAPQYDNDRAYDREIYGGDRDRNGWGRRDPGAAYPRADRGEDYGRAAYQEQGGWGREREAYGYTGRFNREPERQGWQDREYDSWRQNQMSQFDQDYQDYLNERQTRFNSDFDEWRSKRQSMASTETGDPMMSSAQKAATGKKTHN